MKRNLVFSALLAALAVVCLAGCGGTWGGAHEVLPGKFSEREKLFVEALSEDAWVFQLGEGEYEIAIHCYAAGEWFEAGSVKSRGDGSDLFFATQREGENHENLLPDSWVCTFQGAGFKGYMEWPENAACSAAAGVGGNGAVKLEPGVEHTLAARVYENGDSIKMADVVLGRSFAEDRETFTQYSAAWVLTISDAGQSLEL